MVIGSAAGSLWGGIVYTTVYVKLLNFVQKDRFDKVI